MVKLSDSQAFNLWLCDEFNAYAALLSNLEDSFALWKPYEETPNPSDFHIPLFLHLKVGSLWCSFCLRLRLPVVMRLLGTL